jgi:uncharacterized protein YgbK (DUF1537 family)
VIRVGIVADDLTGAMDSAAPFADGGLASRVLLSTPGLADVGDHPAVLAIDTHSRDLCAEVAARTVHAAVAQLAADRLPFKKIDSTLRGNVAAEIAAALQASGRSCAVVAPSAPAQGRVLRDGRLFVNGAGTAGPSLIETLRQGLPTLSVRPLRSGEVPGDEPCVLVADAQTGQELASIAARCLPASGKVLLVGSSGLASALVACLPAAFTRPVHPTYGRLVFVVGSYNARSAAQVGALLSQGDVEALALTSNGELRRIAQGGRGSRIVLLHVEGLGAAPTLDPRRVSQQLAGATADLLSSQPGTSTALFLTGGDTARAVLSRLQVDGVEVIGNLYPGVVHGRIRAASGALGVVTKAGGFGSTDLFAQAVAALVPSAR